MNWFCDVKINFSVDQRSTHLVAQDYGSINRTEILRDNPLICLRRLRRAGSRLNSIEL